MWRATDIGKKKQLAQKVFQSTPSRRGRLNLFISFHISGIFQSTPSRRGRPPICPSGRNRKIFQSTPSRRGRPAAPPVSVEFLKFQSTPSRRGRLEKIWIGLERRYFNPRPREEGDEKHTNRIDRAFISIHALAKRATIITSFYCIDLTISIHALAKRATKQRNTKCKQIFHFNPRPREEGDLLNCCVIFVGSYFNPRPREEGDLKQPSKFTLKSISIHALAKRATLAVNNFSDVINISIHALAKRATLLGLRRTRRCDISIHALAKRATPVRCYPQSVRGHFNPRPREEGDLLCQTARRLAVIFQSTPSRRGRRC